MRTVTLFGFYFVAALIFAVAGWIAWFAWRPRPGKKLIIASTLSELQKGWYQVIISVTNRTTHSFTAVSLRRVRPRSVRMLAPVTSVSTKQGDFQVWSDPAVDKPATTIPLNTMIGPCLVREDVGAVDYQSQISAWLFLPKLRGTRRLTLELSLAGPDESLQRYRFIPRQEPHDDDGRLSRDRHR